MFTQRLRRCPRLPQARPPGGPGWQRSPGTRPARRPALNATCALTFQALSATLLSLLTQPFFFTFGLRTYCFLSPLLSYLFLIPKQPSGSLPLESFSDSSGPARWPYYVPPWLPVTCCLSNDQLPLIFLVFTRPPPPGGRGV